ncbi:uncharacterized protein LOC132050431 [Lycium ferocissimum]|uniref:uncharacterized protein LOC132050431 n=1 Tax=Lycium ferocissimum TaxID=112874 RepID=UPI0028168711|nr:uncharacterized protein LOC132050431 [Lycium ferocissimum]
MVSTNLISLIRRKIMQLSDVLSGKLCKSLLISGLILYVIYILLSNHPCCRSITMFNNLMRFQVENQDDSPTNISHLVFGITSSSRTWKNRISYVESWWRPNITRGFVFLENLPKELLLWPNSSCPPFKVSEDTSRYKIYDKHPIQQTIRMARVVAETFKMENKSARWYIMADDDTVFFLDNLVEVLSKYDHRKYFYVGMNSETHSSNVIHSFNMAFGGGGYAFSYALVEAMVENLDICIKRYTTFYGGDHILQSCVADLGVSLTQEKGFHQMDLHGDISGFLSAHPQSPLISLHHLDFVDPIFPLMNRAQSLNHFMKVAKGGDQSRLLQQSICYHKPKNWTFSISWGYSIQIYESIFPPSFIQIPLQTFIPWSKMFRPFFVINTRLLSNNPCEAPHMLFFESMKKVSGGNSHLLTNYTRRYPRKLPPCSSSGNHSANHISEIHVLSPMKKLDWVGSRRECCDVIYRAEMSVTEIKLRDCMLDEIIP